MPESIKDRPSRAHEYIFLLSKSASYYYDADAIREPHTSLADFERRIKTGALLKTKKTADHSPYAVNGTGRSRKEFYNPKGRNKRSV